MLALGVTDQLTGPPFALSESQAPNRPTLILAPDCSETAEPSRDTGSVTCTAGVVVVTGEAGVVVVTGETGPNGALVPGMAAARAVADERWCAVASAAVARLHPAGGRGRIGG